MKIIVLGGTGMLGQSLCRLAQTFKHTCLSVARVNSDINLDITDDSKLEQILRAENPDVVINACAIVNHKICDQNPQLAYITNSRPSSLLSDLSQEIGYKYIFISTDGYFNGDKNKKHDENSKVTLLNEYARTKYLGEQLTLLNPSALVVRTNIVGFRADKNRATFVEWAIDALKNQADMTLFDDYYTSSISTHQFSKIIFDLLPKNPCGIINIASCEVFSKKTFIETLAKALDLSLKNTKTGSVAELTTSKRADSLGLDVTKAEKILGYSLPTLKEVIEQLKQEYQNV